MANVYVFTADGFEEIEGLTVVDLMRRAGAQVKMVSISDGLAVKGSHGIEIKADTFFDDVDFSQADLLVLPGGMPGTLHLGEHQGLAKLLGDFNARGKRIAAICAAPSGRSTNFWMNSCPPGSLSSSPAATRDHHSFSCPPIPRGSQPQRQGSGFSCFAKEI